MPTLDGGYQQRNMNADVWGRQFTKTLFQRKERNWHETCLRKIAGEIYHQNMRVEYIHRTNLLETQ